MKKYYSKVDKLIIIISCVCYALAITLAITLSLAILYVFVAAFLVYELASYFCTYYIFENEKLIIRFNFKTYEIPLNDIVLITYKPTQNGKVYSFSKENIMIATSKRSEDTYLLSPLKRENFIKELKEQVAYYNEEE